MSRQLKDALTLRLTGDGFRVADNRTCVFRLRFTEQPDQQTPIYRRQLLQGGRGQDAVGNSAEARKLFVVELLVPGETEPIWRDHLVGVGVKNLRDETKDAAARKHLVARLSKQLAATSIPYFLPKDERLLALPAVLAAP